MNKDQIKAWLATNVPVPVTEELEEHMQKAIENLPSTGELLFVVNYEWNAPPHGKGSWRLYEHRNGDEILYLVDHFVLHRSSWVQILSPDQVIDFLFGEWAEE